MLTALSPNTRTKELVKEELFQIVGNFFLSITFFPYYRSPCVPVVGSPAKTCPSLRAWCWRSAFPPGIRCHRTTGEQRWFSRKLPGKLGSPALPGMTGNGGTSQAHPAGCCVGCPGPLSTNSMLVKSTDFFIRRCSYLVAKSCLTLLRPHGL